MDLVISSELEPDEVDFDYGSLLQPIESKIQSSDISPMNVSSGKDKVSSSMIETDSSSTFDMTHNVSRPKKKRTIPESDTLTKKQKKTSSKQSKGTKRKDNNRDTVQPLDSSSSIEVNSDTNSSSVSFEKASDDDTASAITPVKKRRTKNSKKSDVGSEDGMQSLPKKEKRRTISKKTAVKDEVDPHKSKPKKMRKNKEKDDGNTLSMELDNPTEKVITDPIFDGSSSSANTTTTENNNDPQKQLARSKRKIQDETDSDHESSIPPSVSMLLANLPYPEGLDDDYEEDKISFTGNDSRRSSVNRSVQKRPISTSSVNNKNNNKKRKTTASGYSIYDNSLDLPEILLESDILEEEDEVSDNVSKYENKEGTSIFDRQIHEAVVLRWGEVASSPFFSTGSISDTGSSYFTASSLLKPSFGVSLRTAAKRLLQEAFLAKLSITTRSSSTTEQFASSKTSVHSSTVFDSSSIADNSTRTDYESVTTGSAIVNDSTTVESEKSIEEKGTDESESGIHSRLKKHEIQDEKADDDENDTIVKSSNKDSEIITLAQENAREERLKQQKQELILKQRMLKTIIPIVEKIERVIFDRWFVYDHETYAHRIRTLVTFIRLMPSRFLSIDPTLTATMSDMELADFRSIGPTFEHESFMKTNVYGDGSNLTCKKCKKKNIEHTESQMRSSDEPATQFYHCYDCDHRWREG